MGFSVAILLRPQALEELTVKRILLCLLYLSPLFGSPVVYAQQPDSSASAPAQSKAAANPVAPRIDPDKEAAIRRFMQLTGGESIVART